MVLNSTSGILSGTRSEARNLAPYTITANTLAGNNCPRDTADSLILKCMNAAYNAKALKRINRPAKGSLKH